MGATTMATSAESSVVKAPEEGGSEHAKMAEETAGTRSGEDTLVLCELVADACSFAGNKHSGVAVGGRVRASLKGCKLDNNKWDGLHCAAQPTNLGGSFDLVDCLVRGNGHHGVNYSGALPNANVLLPKVPSEARTLFTTNTMMGCDVIHRGFGNCLFMSAAAKDISLPGYARLRAVGNVLRHTEPGRADDESAWRPNAQHVGASKAICFECGFRGSELEARGNAFVGDVMAHQIHARDTATYSRAGFERHNLLVVDHNVHLARA